MKYKFMLNRGDRLLVMKDEKLIMVVLQEMSIFI